MAYLFSQDNPNANVTIFILNFPAKYLPYVMVFITLVSDGPQAAKVQLSGLIAAHLYDFLTRIWPTFGGGRLLITTPLFVKRWFTPEGAGVQARAYGTAIQPRQNVPSNNAWSNQRGPGRRLGGD
jgi:Derlin-2/3